MNRDPLGEAGGINLYGFVGNNPVHWVDSWGLSPVILAENFVLIHGPEITAAVESLFPHLPPNHYVGQLYNLSPLILQANQTLGQGIIDSADY